PLEILFVREVMRTAVLALPAGSSGAEVLASFDGVVMVVAHADEPLRVAVSRMAQTGRTSLPVIANGDPRELVGELTLEDALKA
ncbi:CBS domain-containing protein, partial [Escherichia coli]|uniref:CBS domain-containing protein n=1 Tax=Escherichia coli TaxID=562 RepID=UPI00159BB899